MQIVIEIYKEDFEEICMQASMVEDTGSTFGRIRKAIFHGTPIPKGHGRLIDADVLWDLYHSNDYDFYEALDRAPTIIEADRREEK